MKTRGWGVALLVVAGCYTGVDSGAGDGSPPAADGTRGDADDGSDDGEPNRDTAGDPGDPEPPPNLVAVSGARRLTTAEYTATIRDVLGVEATGAATLLTATSYAPFDNDYSLQTESSAVIVGLEASAREVAAAVVDDPSALQGVLTCAEPHCFDAFLSTTGRRLLRRAVSGAELDSWSSSFLGDTDGDVTLAVETALQFFLQHPDFVYRLDHGTEVGDDVVRLTDWAVASRLAYLLWGSAPDDALLDAAEASNLSRPEDVRDEALRMLEDDRAAARMARFHAMWLNYVLLPVAGEIGSAMHGETEALLRRVIFEDDRPWKDIFREDQTFVTDALAAHYGIEAPDDPNGDWVSYGESGRGGILSHGTFLSNGFKSGDTSPTLRGVTIRERLLCLDVPPPPPDVNDSVPDPDESPTGPCKSDRFAAHATNPSCATCHVLFDGLGWGLENYDQYGQYRASEAGFPECIIDGEGDVPGLGTFRGPAELGQVLAQSPDLDACVVRQLYRFAAGRVELDETDEALIEASVSELGDGEFRFKDVLLEHVSDPGFGFARRAEEGA